MKVQELINQLTALGRPNLEVLLEGSEEEDDHVECGQAIQWRSGPEWPEFVLLRRK